jgi:HAD superfamily hydrolase (TIGR01509 family)
MRYKYFLFDWDGSLADTLPIWFAGFTKIFANYGIEVTNKILGKEVIGDWEGPERLGIVNSDKFFDEVEKEVLEKLNNVKLNPGVYELLTEIKKKEGKIAVITTSKKRWVKGALRANGLRDLIDVFIGKEDVTYTKPDPEGLIKALNFMKGNPEETIMVGDNEKDVMAGRRIGADTGLYFPKRYDEYYEREKQMSLGATYVIEDFGEIKKML